MPYNRHWKDNFCERCGVLLTTGELEKRDGWCDRCVEDTDETREAERDADREIDHRRNT